MAQHILHQDLQAARQVLMSCNLGQVDVANTPSVQRQDTDERGISGRG